MAAIHALAAPHGECWTVAAILQQLALPGRFGVVAEAGGMGLARVVAVEDAEILTLAVVPSARRRGLGRALLAAMEASAAAQGALAMFLEVGVDNDAARRLYQAAGYVRVGLRRRYYPDGGDALVLRRALSTPADDTPADDTLSDDTLADDTLSDDTPTDDTPADDTPADQAASEPAA